ncbi:MAG TPA: serpin family protein [Longimicrobiales bacterium]|nr:serpin family protein [Longimicrobiales bacterium]
MLKTAVVRLSLSALFLVGCSDAVGPDPAPITELPRALTVAEQAVIRHGNAFGIDLMREVVSRDGRPNVILSPLSASMALGMTLNGAAEGTFDAMRSTLGFAGMSQAEINEAYRGLMDLLTGLDPAVRFDIANSVWANKDVPFHEAFLQAVRDAFDARVESRDFADPATLQAVNDWVSQNTEGLIPSILDYLEPSLVMLLINAIYFDGAWTSRFDPADTRLQDFRREDQSTVQVDMMSLSKVKVPVSLGPGYAAVELPYGGEAYSMVVVLPTDARQFLASLDADRWRGLIDGLTPTELDVVSIPKFTLDFDAYLNEALKAMGMGVAFRPGADFTRLSPQGDAMCISFVRQKTFVEVNERGTRAAAVTAVGIGRTSFNGLVANQPFVFAIRERLSGTLLFLGMVGDPTAEDPGAEPLVSECG